MCDATLRLPSLIPSVKHSSVHKQDYSRVVGSPPNYPDGVLGNEATTTRREFSRKREVPTIRQMARPRWPSLDVPRYTSEQWPKKYQISWLEFEDWFSPSHSNLRWQPAFRLIVESAEGDRCACLLRAHS